MATKTKTAQAVDNVERIRKQFEKALAVQYEQSQSILREGSQIVVPQFMTLKDAAKAITAFEEQREEMVSKRLSFECHPHDGLVNFYKAMQETFGTILASQQEINSFFGSFTVPGQSISVPIDFDESTTVPIGTVEVPGLPISIEINVRSNENNPVKGLVVVDLEYKRLYEPLVEQIEAITKRRLKSDSIFRNKALNSKFEFLDLRADTSKIVYSQIERAQVDANIFTPIEMKAECKRAGIPIKRTVLLHGRFGTGKTLTALAAAKTCVENGWTFINVAPGDSIIRALEFARVNQPCLVFFEDIDVSTSGDRSDALNEVLNHVDGLLSKTAEVMTILTTNRIDHINKAMLRPGRIDAVIELGYLDVEAVAQLVRGYGGEMLEGELDEQALFDAAEGYVPAFIAEAVHRAKNYAVRHSNNGSKLKVTTKDVENALIGLRAQYNLMIGKQATEKPTLDKALTALVQDSIVDPLTNAVNETLKDKLNPCAVK
jgi:transitional endoplasmic reticulum ATPase